LGQEKVEKEEEEEEEEEKTKQLSQRGCCCEGAQGGMKGGIGENEGRKSE